MKINKKIIGRKKENLIKKFKIYGCDNYVFAFNLIIYIYIYHNESFDNITFASSLDNDPYYAF